MEFTELSDRERAAWEHLYTEGFASLDDPALPETPRALLTRIAWCVAVSGRDDDLLELASCEGAAIARWLAHPVFAGYLVRAYEHFVARGSAGACCNLGSLYYGGEGVKQDFEAARELYELGSARGDEQATINLGYIYYYGRSSCGVDYARAYECFARVALTSGHPEALWKLGDLYAGGRGVVHSDAVAWDLYLKAYANAGDAPLAGRAAHHVADYLMSGIEGLIEPNPEAALKLYVEAEIGYRHLIRDGQTHYQGCLDGALEGQQRAREAIAAALGE